MRLILSCLLLLIWGDVWAQPAYRPPARPIPPRDQRPGSVLRRDLTRQGIQILPGVPARPQDAWRPGRTSPRAESIAPPGWKPPGKLLPIPGGVQALAKEIEREERGERQPPVLTRAVGAAGQGLNQICQGAGCKAPPRSQIRVTAKVRRDGTVARADAECPTCGGMAGATAEQRPGGIGVSQDGLAPMRKVPTLRWNGKAWVPAQGASGVVQKDLPGPTLTPGGRAWGESTGFKNQTDLLGLTPPTRKPNPVTGVSRDLWPPAPVRQGGVAPKRPSPLSTATESAGQTLVRLCKDTGCKDRGPIIIQRRTGGKGKVAHVEATCPAGSCYNIASATAQRRKNGKISVEYNADQMRSPYRSQSGGRFPRPTSNALDWAAKQGEAMRADPPPVGKLKGGMNAIPVPRSQFEKGGKK